MRYTKEIADKLVQDYQNGVTKEQLAEELNVPVRSIVAKLASLGVYQKKVYVNKLGEPPVKKEFYIQRLSELLDENVELLESLEKVNKRVLQLLVDRLETD
jgi:hypothetical protein